MNNGLIKKKIDRVSKFSKFEQVPPRNHSGVGHIIIPSDIEREDYIKIVNSTGRCNIVTTYDDPVRNVIIPVHILRDLKFPDRAGQRGGSLLYWNSIPNTNQIIITAIIPEEDQINQQKEGQLIEKRSYKNYTQSDTTSSLDNTRVISIKDEEGDSGEIIIQVAGSEKKSVIVINAKGEMKISNDRLFSVFCEDELSIKIGSKQDEISILKLSRDGVLEYSDKFENKLEIKENGISIISSKKVSIKNSDETAVKLIRDILTMYMKTKTIDGKPLDPTSMDNAIELIERNHKLFF
jgi:hypothetical protein